MTGTAPRIFRLVPDEPDQVVRLLIFRVAHPEVLIGNDDYLNWQARIPDPEGNGEVTAVRYTLRELLDRLDELTGDPADPG